MPFHRQLRRNFIIFIIFLTRDSPSQLQGGASSNSPLSLGCMINTPPPTPPCPHLAPTFIFSARLLMGEGLIQASQLRSRPRKRLAPLRRLAAVDPPTLVGGKDRRGVRVCACTRVSVETVWNSLLHASVSSALPFSLFIVRARGEGRGLQDKRQKGFLMLHSCPMTGWRSRCAA